MPAASSFRTKWRGLANHDNNCSKGTRVTASPTFIERKWPGQKNWPGFLLRPNIGSSTRQRVPDFSGPVVKAWACRFVLNSGVGSLKQNGSATIDLWSTRLRSRATSITAGECGKCPPVKPSNPDSTAPREMKHHLPRRDTQKLVI